MAFTRLIYRALQAIGYGPWTMDFQTANLAKFQGLIHTFWIINTGNRMEVEGS